MSLILNFICKSLVPEVGVKDAFMTGNIYTDNEYMDAIITKNRGSDCKNVINIAPAQFD